jgi:phosphomethylpyrimidine synthase
MGNHAPYYMLGPLSTDVGAGYDHVVAAIGAAQSARFGADLVCYITPAEHLALPNEKDVGAGVKAARLAAHIGDLSKLPERTRSRDEAMSKFRRDLDWSGQFDNALFPVIFYSGNPGALKGKPANVPDHFMVKPFEMSALMKVINTIDRLRI